MKAVWTVIFLCSFACNAKELRWDWRTAPVTKVNFPKDFLWGVVTHAHQVEGNCANNWTRWEEIKKLERSGNACEHEVRCFDDIALLQELGVKAYRFSVEWSKIEPQQGTINYEVLYRYRDFCDALKSVGIMPVVTLYAGTHPVWFDDRGGFEQEQNISLFAHFCEVVFQSLHSRVDIWCILNEPAMYVFNGYMRGTFPPGKIDALLAGKVLQHLLQAHCKVYRKLKSMQPSAKIGIAHTIVQFDPYRDWNPLDTIASNILTHVTNNVVIDFFKTGSFRFDIQGVVAAQMGWQASTIIYKDVHAAGCLDFFGINYYSHVIVNSFTGKEEYLPEDIKTDMSYAFYPEGLYRAIIQASSLGVPLYITENGIADTKDDRRHEWLKRYIYVINKAIHEGYNVRGYFYRSFMDCFEWDRGYTMKFGLYHVDFATQKRTLRKGADYFVKMAHR